jgi:hypothetical protein
MEEYKKNPGVMGFCFIAHRGFCSFLRICAVETVGHAENQQNQNQKQNKRTTACASETVSHYYSSFS